MKRSKPSGAQFRKRRKEEEEKKDKYKGGDEQTSETPSCSSATQAADTEPADTGSGTSSASLHPTDTEPADADTEPASSKGTTITAPIDPGDWLAVSDAVRTEMVERGPYQLFSNKDYHLISVGLNDWRNCNDILRSHENGPEHSRHMGAWRELESRLHKGQTIDKAEMALLQAERRKWHDILTRLVAIIQSLAERNIALRGTSDQLYKRNNGNFLKEVELRAKFDPFLKQHVASVQRRETRTTYLGKDIQNELIDCIGGKIIQTVVSEVKRAKYFSIIFDCTPDLSHTEQLSVILRIVAVEDSPIIKEHFMGFLEVESSTGESLSNLILKKLENLTIAFEDCRGQSYDNGANMKGKSKGVQARLLKMNPRALFVPWDILKRHVTITVKSWSDTRWESRVNSVHAVRFQSAEVRDALLEVRDQAKEPIIKTEAQSLAEEVGSYHFAICCVVWYDILSKVQHVSKLLQSASMQVDIALNLIQTTEASLSTYRTTGFASAQVSARDVCGEMNVEALEASFFNVVVDVAISSLRERFQALGDVGEKFGVLTDFPNLCEALGHTLSHSGQSDLDWRELAQEMLNFPQLPKAMNTLELLMFLHEKKLEEVFPNMWVALRIAATLPVTVGSAERSFSRLKLIKTYLRSTMSQDRLNGLALISINREVSNEISYDDTINEFATRKTRRVRF
ncbi:zinc finger MYM-type protein 1-like [Odontesthes bonariensis]|uniref:zinc finger MYM-type protein 1-like n=1 Tax=Odontesthes bonariensis TaxID=219752 RepID=UPI003F58E53B